MDIKELNEAIAKVLNEPVALKESVNTVYIIVEDNDLTVYTPQSFIAYAEKLRQDNLSVAGDENIGWNQITNALYAMEYLTEARGYDVRCENVL